jgi:F0F1-type ATP synthase epsilon subunit
MNNDSFRLIIRTREGEVFNGEVFSISSLNKDGKFDILAYHANFISLVEKYLEFKNTDGEIRNMAITKALLRFKDNSAEVYVGVGL